MSLKILLAKPFASLVYRNIIKHSHTALADQETIFKTLIKNGGNTLFGKDHKFDTIRSYQSFKQAVPVRDYEQLKSYIEKVKAGEKNILWKGKPIYFAKTSGTTSGVKYIPITKDSIANHINTARNALLCYMAVSGNYQFVGGKLIFLSGSPVLDDINGIKTGRLSGIVNHHVPGYLRSNQLPPIRPIA